jgi:RNase P subunit RPR2
MKKSSKEEAKEKISDFFKDIKNKDSKQVKKIKRLAMKKSISLKEKRKTFCKKCLAPYNNPKIRVKNKIKSITCEKCGHIARWRIKTS